MEGIEKRFSLAEGRGALHLREEGPRVALEATLRDDRRGLYKAYLCGAGGKYLLGTLAPENGLLRLRRTISTDELRRKGVWPPTGAGVELAFPVGKPSQPVHGNPAASHQERAQAGWTREQRPDRLMGDDLLARAAQRLQGTLVRREAGGFTLAVPWEEDRGFPLCPIFCFAELKKFNGALYAFFSFDGQGLPTFRHKEAGTGQTNQAGPEAIRG